MKTQAQATTSTQIAEGALPAEVAAPVARFDRYLLNVIDSLDLPANLRDALRYAALGPGKRLRPLLTWHSFVATADVRLDPEACLPAAAAVEMVHAFSLVHDDLPGIDNDDLRRGRPTLHRHSSEAMAILAGDSLLTLSFGLLFDSYPAAIAAPLARELAVGTNAMIAGQVYDTLGGFEPGLSDEQKLELIHLNKTGALIVAACRMGAIVATSHAGKRDPDQAKLDAITRHAHAIGLMFQVVDDLLDVTQSTEHLGKTAGKDVSAGKLTYPAVLGIEESRRKVRQLHQSAAEALRPLGPAARTLDILADFMAVRTR
ncbi:MAG: polyprenyl synthetase family protein [Phycisphaeraceae bacterium]|nr:polyprenyl synthetase family protein [Phycisphaeraceae bacterium]